MKRKVRFLTLILCLFLCLHICAFFAVAESTADFSVEISVPETVYEDSRIRITLSTDNITTPLSGVEFVLYFDSTLLTPEITENQNDEMDAFIKKSPQDSWEQFCRMDSEGSYYYLRFSAPEDGSDEDMLLKNKDDLIVEIPFTAAALGECVVSVPDKDIIGVDRELELLRGSGGSLTFTIIECREIAPYDESGLVIFSVEDNKYITGVRENTPLSELLEQLINSELTVTDRNQSVITDGVCKTGYVISLYDGESLQDSVILVIKGDINGDGKVSSADYLYAKRAFLGTLELSPVRLQAANLDGTGKITAVTYLMIKRHVFGTYNIYG